METTILEDNTLFLSAVLLGFFFGLFYECFRFLRLSFPHPAFLIFLEDLIFFFPVTLIFLIFNYALSDGIVRWFSFAGTAAGFFLYLNTLGKILLFFSEAILKAVRSLFRFLFRIFIFPVINFFKKITNCLFVRIKKSVIIGKTKYSFLRLERRKKRLLQKAKRGF